MMGATTRSDFGANTEALDVARAFPGQIQGKTILVTGVNAKGIGFTTAEGFASQSPAHLVITGRNANKIQESVDALKAKYPSVDVRPLELNLASQKTVRKAAAEVLSWPDVPSIDIVVNNAGVMFLPTRELNEDGIEMTFATNHVGHFLFVNLIAQKLIEAAKHRPKGAVRVVNVSSLSPTVAAMRWSDMNFEKTNSTLPQAEQPPYMMHKAWGAENPEDASYLPLEAYNQSKVANLLFSIGANHRLFEKHGILSFTVHPGVITTELSRNASSKQRERIAEMEASGMFARKTLGAGASTSLVAALDPKLGPGEAKNGKENLGTFLADCQISDQAAPLAESNSEAERLWTLSEKLVGEKFDH